MDANQDKRIQELRDKQSRGETLNAQEQAELSEADKDAADTTR